MPKKKIQENAPKPNDNWIYETEILVNGRKVVPGTELSIHDERGRFRFVRQVTTEKQICWIDVISEVKGSEAFRSFYPSKIKRVHYKNQTLANLAKEHKEKQKLK